VTAEDRSVTVVPTVRVKLATWAVVKVEVSMGRSKPTRTLLTEPKVLPAGALETTTGPAASATVRTSCRGPVALPA
jgi:hypothetical protein